MRVLKKLHEITSKQGVGFEEKVQALLAFGLKIFELDIAIVSQVNGDLYVVKHVISPDDAIPRYAEFEFKSTYCFLTLNAKKAIGFHHIGDSELHTHPCYESTGLESYIGAPIVINGVPYGTVNFTSSTPKTSPFSSQDYDYIDLLSLWIANEIGRQNTLFDLQKKNEALEAMSALATIGYWDVDLEHDRLYLSDTVRGIHGLTKEVHPTMREMFRRFYDTEENAEAIASIRQAHKEGKAWSVNMLINTASGAPKWVAAQGQPVFENGECVRIFGATQDIDEQVKLRIESDTQKQEAERLLAERTRFLAKISHELRTPVNGINGMLAALDTNMIKPENIKRVDIAKKSVNTLSYLLNDLLDYAKLEHGSLELEHIAFNVQEELTSVIALYENIAQNKGVLLSSQFNITPHKVLRGDPNRLKQILSNLLSNAVKFTEQGRVTVSVSTVVDKHKVKLVCEVTDSGIGISQQAQSNLFKPFTQEGQHTAREFGGTGLGLSIVKELCEKMEGSASVTSTLGKGATFSVDVLLDLADDDLRVDAPAVKPANLTLPSGLHVLVVEDNEINQIVLQELLSQANITADYVDNGELALTALEQASPQQFDCVLMDCTMPVMDGFEATRRIRAFNNGYESIPIIALTANTMPEDKLACAQAGMNDFIAKPVQLDDIKQAIARVL